MASLPVVAIIGRPNVGKSALFNRFLGKRQALVDATPGLTRDRLYGDVTWKGFPFRVVDTGGLEFSRGDRIQEAVAAQVGRAMEEASLALLVCDGIQGPVPLDGQVADWARRWGKPVLLVASKVDNDRVALNIPEFSRLGLGPPLGVSALHGLETGDLLDRVVERLKSVPGAGAAPPAGAEQRPVRLAIVGRPNVGKSTLINRILNEERVLVDAQPGTTRDAVEARFSWREMEYLLVDTAGIRAKKRIKTRIDAVTRMKSLEVIRQADVCVGVLEGPAGIIQEDLKILDEVVTAGRALCLAVNKWDLLPPKTDPETVARTIARRAPFLRFAPVVLISAKTGFQVTKLLAQATAAAQAANKRITGGQGRDLLELIRGDSRAPAAVRGAHLIRLAQVEVGPPTFHLLLRSARLLRASDLSYLEGVFRREIGLEGTPLRIHLLRKR